MGNGVLKIAFLIQMKMKEVPYYKNLRDAGISFAEVTLLFQIQDFWNR